MKWFRMYAEFAKDPKVQMLSEAMQRRLVMLFCLECSGELEGLDDDEIAFALHIENETLHETFHVFQKKGFMDENRRIINWNKRQYKSDNSTDRVKKYREKTKTKKSVTPKKRYSNKSVTPPDTDTDTDTEEEKEDSSIAFSLYNDLAKKIGLSVAQVFTDKRKRSIRQRLSECGGIDGWKTALDKIEKSDFCSGRKTDFRADLDFILQKSRFVSLMEGKYDNHGKGKQNGKAKLAAEASELLDDIRAGKFTGSSDNDHQRPEGLRKGLLDS